MTDPTLPIPGRQTAAARPTSPSRVGPAGLGPTPMALSTRERAAQFALMYAVTYSLGFTGFVVTRWSERAEIFTSIRLPIVLASVTAALLLHVAIRRRWFDDRTRSALTVAFVAVGTLGIVVIEDWHLQVLAGQLPEQGISWACVVLVILPLFVDMRLPYLLVGGLVSALSGPVFLALVARAHGLDLPWDHMARLGFPLMISALVSLGPAVLLTRFRHSLDEARRFGSYRMVERIGEGGMGEVWRAEHAMLARPAAIKYIRPGMVASADPDAVEALFARFEREARATAALQSPHTIEVYDFGVTDDGCFYYVMELLDGVDLESLVVHEGALPPARAIHLLAQAGHSLAEAHARGFLHRDVKPANLFVCRRGLDDDVVKVLDFGLVSRFDDGGDSKLTREGVVSGTPAFLAPEVATDSGSPDPRADVYALGCVAFWLLTGELPFTADNPVAMLVKHVHEAPPAPSSRLDTPLPEALDALVLRCLAKDPAERPSDAGAFLTELKAIPIPQ